MAPLSPRSPQPTLLLRRVSVVLSRDAPRHQRRPVFCLQVANESSAAAAAKINAQLQARKGIQHVDVPPIRNASPPPTRPAPSSNNSSHPPPVLDGEMYVADGDYIQDIEVNDLRNRYLLTKGSTQKMVNTLDYSLMLSEPSSRSCFLHPSRKYHAYLA